MAAGIWLGLVGCWVEWSWGASWGLSLNEEIFVVIINRTNVLVKGNHTGWDKRRDKNNLS